MPIEAFPAVSAGRLRKRSVGNLLRMGHCAPTVMKTMLDSSDTEAKWLVLLMAGLPGGIGNTGGECGGLTAPLALMGLRHGRDQTAGGLPLVVDKGHDLLQRFTARCGEVAAELAGAAQVLLQARRAGDRDLVEVDVLDADGAVAHHRHCWLDSRTRRLLRHVGSGSPARLVTGARNSRLDALSVRAGLASAKDAVAAGLWGP